MKPLDNLNFPVFVEKLRLVFVNMNDNNLEKDSLLIKINNKFLKIDISIQEPTVIQTPGIIETE